MKRVPAGWLSLDPVAGDRPGQVYRRLRERILSGDLRGGACLPSSRRLAETLGVARATVVLAYERLRAEGFVEGRPGAPTRVAALPARVLPGPPAQPPLPAAAPPALAFAPGVPDLSAFPRALWARCLAARSRSLRTDDLGTRPARACRNCARPSSPTPAPSAASWLNRASWSCSRRSARRFSSSRGTSCGRDAPRPGSKTLATTRRGRFSATRGLPWCRCPWTTPGQTRHGWATARRRSFTSRPRTNTRRASR